MDQLNKEFQVLEELLRTASSLISPISYHDELRWLTNPTMRLKHFEKYPQCFMRLRKRGRDVPFFPVCNRMGMIDPNIIALSMKMAHALKDKPEIEGNQIDIILKKLERMHNKYSKEIPKPADMASKKAFITKTLNNMRSKLKSGM